MNPTKIDKRTGLPAFLITPQAKRNEVWRRNPPKPMPLMVAPVSEAREHQPLPEFAVTKKAKSLGKLKAWQREGSVKRDAKGVLRNKDGVPVRWNPMRTRFEPERCYGGAGPVPSPLAAKHTSSPSVKALERAPTSDDIVDQIKSRIGMDAAKLKAFAVANGCWDDKYETLPNVGLRRMNVVNRLRAKVRKGYQVVW